MSPGLPVAQSASCSLATLYPLPRAIRWATLARRKRCPLTRGSPVHGRGGKSVDDNKKSGGGHGKPAGGNDDNAHPPGGGVN